MKAILLVALLAAPVLLAPAAQAGIEWLPVCKDKDVRVGPYVWLHVGVDCYPGVWLQVCPSGGEDCERVDASLA